MQFLSSASDLMKSTVVDESLSTNATRVLFQRKTTSFFQETTKWETYTRLSIMNVFQELVSQPPPLSPWAAVVKHELHEVLDIPCHSQERELLCKLTTCHIHGDGGFMKYGFLYWSGHFIQFLAQQMFGKSSPPHSYLWGVKDWKTLLF